MAKEIEFDAPTGSTCYAQLRSSVGTIWRIDSAAFEAYATANIAHYNIPATEQGSASGFFTADMPVVVADSYNVTAKKQAGGSPAESDLTVGVGNIEWSGAAVGVVARLFASISESTETFIQTLRLIRSAVVGKCSGFPTGPGLFRDAADTKARITATLDGSGNRTAITTDGT